MNNTGYIRVLVAFAPFLRLIKSYNLDNFHHCNWRCNLASVKYAFITTTIIVSIPIFHVLGIWHLIENEADLSTISVSLPILTSFTQMELTLIALILKNRTIDETIKRIQQLVDEREFLLD